MTLPLKTYKRVWFLIVISYFMAGYMTLNWRASLLSHHYDISFFFENKIPFIPFFILGYLLVYLALFGLYFLIDNKALFKKSLVCFFIISTLHFIIFYFFPVKMALRPVMPEDGPIINALVRLYYWVDMPYNCFPSLHVAYTLIGVFLLWSYKRLWSYIYLIATIIVGLSVVLVRQHYIMDVVGGVGTTTLVYLVVSRMRFQTEE